MHTVQKKQNKKKTEHNLLPNWLSEYCVASWYKYNNFNCKVVRNSRVHYCCNLHEKKTLVTKLPTVFAMVCFVLFHDVVFCIHDCYNGFEI